MADAARGSLWDDHFRARMLRHALSNDEIAQAVEAAEAAAAERDQLQAEVVRLREALERVYQIGRGPHVGIAREALDAWERDRR